MTELAVLLHQEAARLADEVVEVDRAGRGELRLVLLEDAADRVVHVADACAAHRLGLAPLLLLFLDRVEQLPRRVALLVEVELLHRARHERSLVLRVVDDEVRRDAHGRAVSPQEPRARRVERADPELLRELFPEQTREPRAHLARRLVRERDREDAVRRDARLGHEVRDAIGDDARLSAARAREDEERPVDVRDGFRLRRIQSVFHGLHPTPLMRAKAELKAHATRRKRRARCARNPELVRRPGSRARA